MTNLEKIAAAKAALARANDGSLALLERQEAFNEADTIRKEAKVGWSKIGEVPDLTALIEESNKVAGNPTSEGTSATPAAEVIPALPGTLNLRNPIQVAIFKEMILGEMTHGKWAKTRPLEHAKPWLVANVAVDPNNLGITFSAQKVNYNVNDSNWVNQPEITKKLLAVATAANGGKDMSKKAVVAELVDMKAIFGMVAKAADPVASEEGQEAKDAVEEVIEQIASETETNSEAGDEVKDEVQPTTDSEASDEVKDETAAE